MKKSPCDHSLEDKLNTRGQCIKQEQPTGGLGNTVGKENSAQCEFHIRESQETVKMEQQIVQHRPSLPIENDNCWGKSEQLLLFSLHEQLGNRWAQISKRIPGKSINSVKNRFYSTLRKGLKNINKYIRSFKHKYRHKKVNSSVLPKLFEVIADSFQRKLDTSEEVLLLSFAIKVGLFYTSNESFCVEQNESQICNTIKNLYLFNHLYRKKRTPKQSGRITERRSKKSSKKALRNQALIHFNHPFINLKVEEGVQAMETNLDLPIKAGAPLGSVASLFSYLQYSSQSLEKPIVPQALGCMPQDMVNFYSVFYGIQQNQADVEDRQLKIEHFTNDSPLQSSQCQKESSSGLRCPGASYL